MPTHPTRRPAWLLVALVLATIAAVTIAGLLIVASPTWSATELQAVVAVHSLQSVVFDVVALTINTVFGPSGSVLVVALVAGWAYVLTRSWQRPIRIFIVIAVPWACAELLKAVVQRPRPDPALLEPLIVPDPATFSYPSGHTAFAAALCTAIIVVMSSGRSRAVWVGLGAVIVLLTAWSRVYLGVHYPTDVIASMLLVPVLAIGVDHILRRWEWLSSPRQDTPPGA